MPNTDQALLRARGLVKKFHAGKRTVDVLRGVDLDLFPGGSLVILGPSGCGKSTLLHVLSLLDRSDSGELLIEGVDYGAASEGERRRYRERHVGFIFQAFHLVPELTVAQNAALPGRLSGSPRAAARANELLERLGLTQLAGASPAVLSGGERQRTAVARALHHRPRWLFADEPTGNLDPETGDQVMTLIRDTCTEVGAHLILVTHNEGLIRPRDTVVRLDHGKIRQLIAATT